MTLGGGPGISLYSFHGRGTLNGTIPHPALVPLFEDASRATGIPLQRSAHTGALTDSSYVQLVGQGVAAIDVGFPDALLAFLARGLRPPRSRAADATFWSTPFVGSTPASASTGRLSVSGYYLGIDIGTFESKGVLVDGAGRIVATAVTAAQDAGAAARLGRAPAEAGLVGRFCLSVQGAARAIADVGREPSARSAPAPSAPACCRSMPTARRCERRALRRRRPRLREIEDLNARDRRGAHPDALRQRADLAVGRAERSCG